MDIQIPDELKKLYIERRKADYETLLAALENSLPVEFKKIGHQLIGNASTFGFHDLSEIGIKMNKIESYKDLADQGKIILTELKSWIERNEIPANSGT